MIGAYPLLQVYGPVLPDFLAEAAEAPLMRRLRGVGMNCGCEYTDFPRFREIGPYSRFDHSLGTALIVWRFTRSPAQALAGLLHDAATPVFAHVIDFLRGDYLRQEATEDGTAERISADPVLAALLHEMGLTVADVGDYHRYPIADNDAPRLSADRLEYSLGNMVNYGIRSPDRARALFEDISVLRNEEGAAELGFLHADAALDFAEAALECSRIYVSDEDRYAMQMLAELVRDALAAAVISEADLRATEPELLEKLCVDPVFASRWNSFRSMSRIRRSPEDRGGNWRQIFAKKRCIDPLIAGAGRVSAESPDFAAALAQFRAQPQDHWVLGESHI